MERTPDEIYREAISKWGSKPQLLMFIEESSELTHALCAYLRGRDVPTDAILEEMADCQIMLDQLKIVFEGDGFERFKAAKLKRLDERLHPEERKKLDMDKFM